MNIAAEPYERDMVVRNGSTTLAGTLLMPSGVGPHPAVVFVHGSGDTSRQEHHGLAAELQQAGIAGLVYDKRGVGDSTGDWEVGTFDDLAADALAGVHAVQRYPGIDPGRVGLYGQSQGGWLVPLAASRSTDVAFVIVVSAAGVNPWYQMRYYFMCASRAAGVSGVHLALRDLLFMVVSGVAIRLPPWLYPPRWGVRFGVNAYQFDPVPVWERVRQPVLAIWGAADAVVPAHGSARVIERALRHGGNHEGTIRLLPGRDHMLQPVASGNTAAGESSHIDAIVTWVRETVIRPR